jgi:hypothetical protein
MTDVTYGKTECRGCGKLHLDAAETCPHCGVRLRMSSTAKILIVCGIVAVAMPLTCVVGAVALGVSNRHQEATSPTPATAQKPAATKSPDLVALEAACGEKPERARRDGKIYGLRDTLAKLADDPDSVEVSNCTEPIGVDAQTCWVYACDVRANNRFGAKVLKRRAFRQAKGRLYDLEPEDLARLAPRPPTPSPAASRP